MHCPGIFISNNLGDVYLLYNCTFSSAHLCLYTSWKNESKCLVKAQHLNSTFVEHFFVVFCCCKRPPDHYLTPFAGPVLPPGWRPRKPAGARDGHCRHLSINVWQNKYTQSSSMCSFKQTMFYQFLNTKAYCVHHRYTISFNRNQLMSFGIWLMETEQ